LPEAEQAATLDSWNDILTLWNHHSALPDLPPTDLFWRLVAPHLPKRNEHELEAVLGRTAARFLPQWRAFEESVREVLRVVAAANEQPVPAVKQAALRVGLVLALAQAAKRQRVRIGQKWIHDVNGRRVLFTSDEVFVYLDSGEPGAWTRSAPPPLVACPPISLPLVHLEAWLRHEAIQAAEAWLLDQPYPAVAGDVLEEAEPQDEEQMDRAGPPLVDSLDAVGESRRDDWTDLVQAVTPLVREKLERLQGLVRLGLTVPEAKQALAEVRNERVGAIDTAFSRLRHATTTGTGRRRSAGRGRGGGKRGKRL